MLRSQIVFERNKDALPLSNYLANFALLLPRRLPAVASKDQVHGHPKLGIHISHTLVEVVVLVSNFVLTVLGLSLIVFWIPSDSLVSPDLYQERSPRSFHGPVQVFWVRHTSE